jgi:uncharacterized protein YdeI (BOF family)
MSAPRGVFAGLVSFLVFVSTLAATVPVGHAASLVSWPASAGIVLAEVMTGGASASDEYVEIANAASTPQDLQGLELVYVTASGSTFTRKANFTSSLSLAPCQHLLIANAAGIFGPLADLTYSGGIASDGGALVIRYLGGALVDSVGWGSAANSFVEGSPAPAPAARSSIERRPGGADGNRLDTNDNLADWLAQSNPVPQSLASTPTPGASSAPPTSSPPESPAPSQEAASASEPAATATPAAPTATVTPTFAPPTAAPATPGPTPSPSPSPSPSAAVTPVAEARIRADGAAVTIEGVLTIRLAALESGRGGFVQDASGGIALYLPEVPAPALAAGTRVRVGGTLDDRYGQRTIRVDEGGLVALGEDPLPEPVHLATGEAGESAEGIVVAISGTVTATPDSLSDGLGIWLDDGSGPLRVVAAPSALGDLAIAKGMSLAAMGPLGQRASGSSPGYRVEATEPGSIEVLAQPSPSPTAQASSDAVQTASPSPRRERPRQTSNRSPGLGPGRRVPPSILPV